MFFANYTIVHAFDNARLRREFEENKNLNFISVLKKGIYIGAMIKLRDLMIVTAIAIAVIAYSRGLTGLKTRSSSLLEIASPFEISILGPIREEILCRGIVQNGIYYSQKLIEWGVPEVIKHRRIFEYLTSPSIRVLSANSFFALMHLPNRNYFSLANTIAQIVSIVLMPTMSILHETTGSIIAPIACHITYNMGAVLLAKSVEYSGSG